MFSVNNSTTFLFSLFGWERMLETFSSECAEMYSNGLVVRAKPSHTSQPFLPTNTKTKTKTKTRTKTKTKKEGEDKDDDEDEDR